MAEDREIRLTPQREAVLTVIRGARDHPTAAQIYNRVRESNPGIAYATVYNALGYLVKHDLVRELRFGDNASRYDGRLDPHLHVSCSSCGRLAEAEITMPPEVMHEAETATGYHLKGHVLQLFGICPTCRNGRH